MDDRIQRQPPWIPWAVTSVALVLVALVAYSFGAHQEVAGGGGAGTVWRGSPFSGIWILFIVFWLFGGLRWMWGGWGGCYGPRRYRRYYPAWHDRDDWEEWHRREHERMNGPAGSGASSRSETGQRPV